MINQIPAETGRLPKTHTATGKSPPRATYEGQARVPGPPADGPETESKTEQVTFWIILVLLFVVSAIACYLLWAKLTLHAPWS